MSINISDIFTGLASQQIPALITILSKAKEFAQESGIADEELLATRLHDEMHPLSWQLQTTVELVQRGASRLLKQEPASLVLEEDNFEALIARITNIQSELLNLDNTVLNQSVNETFEIPVGPEASLSLTGQDYVLKFLLPNVYFHLTTSYALLRMRGVAVGKRDFMGPF
jgi:hypothetical protein